MGANAHLDVQRIEAALLSVQKKLDQLGSGADVLRDPLDRHVIENMVAGYVYVERLVADKIDIFAMGQHQHMLELNRLVLCGTDAKRRKEYAAHFAATEHRFYEERNAGIEDVAEWYRAHAHRSLWERAAGIYLRILMTPQLFLEGNNRTGALVMSYVLVREGEPPFVLTAENAAEYFRPSTDVREIRKSSLAAWVRLPGARRRLARLLQRESAARYLVPAGPDACVQGPDQAVTH